MAGCLRLDFAADPVPEAIRGDGGGGDGGCGDFPRWEEAEYIAWACDLGID